MSKIETLLWEDQAESFALCKKYIEDFKRKDLNGSCLIQLPTGAGKSGVITAVSLLLDRKRILVLTPRKNLSKQLYENIRGSFFKKINFQHDYKNTAIFLIEKGEQLETVEYKSVTILVMTIHMYCENKEKVSNNDLVIFDEGHCEPSSSWSACVRGNTCPRIIFTATPFRNDLKKFDTIQEYIHTMTHFKAQEKLHIRELEIKKVIENENDFLTTILSEFNKLKENGLIEIDSKLIIQCDDKSNIEDLCYKINNEHPKLSYVALHEKFDNSDRKHKYRDVNLARKKNDDAIVWIHQYKLIEGIDDSRYRVLALYKRTYNARLFIQQVGRILRNSSHTKKEMAYLIDYTNDHHESMWNNYLEYNNYIADQKSSYSEVIFNAYTENLGMDYIDKKFRKQLTPDTLANLNPLKGLQIPLRTVVYENIGDLTIDNIKNSFLDFYKNDINEIFPISCDDKEMEVLLVQEFKNSPVLVENYYIETQLKVITFISKDNYIYSNINIFTTIDLKSKLKVVNGDVLKKVFANSEQSSLTKISLSNTDLSKYTPRTKSFSALSVEDLYSNIDDNMQICTSASGYSSEIDRCTGEEEWIGKYVGLTRGKVSRINNRYMTLSEYKDWIEDLHQQITDDNESIVTFNRYAQPIEDVKNLTPKSILLDCDVISNLRASSGENESIFFSDICSEIIDNKFNITINEDQYDLTLHKDSGKWSIKCNELSEKYIVTQDKSNETDIITHVNREQAFRLIFDEVEICYYRNYYYNVSLKIGENFDPKYKLDNCLFPYECLNKPISEKGEKDYYKGGKDTWAPNSLFGIISSFGVNGAMTDCFNGYSNCDTTILICDDMNRESCDFILCDTESKKVAFIHAKSANEGKEKEQNRYTTTTSYLHEVCAQAQKNLFYLTPTNTKMPNNCKNGAWAGPWILKEGFTVKKRVVTDFKFDEVKDIWNAIDDVIKDPNSDREVWLFLGNIYSKSAFEKKLKKNKKDIDPVALNGYYLLNSTMNQVGAIGAKFRVICGV